jgi:hypothetical protein
VRGRTGEDADLNAAVEATSNQVFSRWIPFGLAAPRSAYPQAHVDRYLNVSAQGAPMRSFEAWPGSVTRGSFHRFARDSSPVGFGGTPTAPVYRYHGTADELLPVGAGRELASRYRAGGADVVLVEHEGRTHGSENGLTAAWRSEHINHVFDAVLPYGIEKLTRVRRGRGQRERRHIGEPGRVPQRQVYAERAGGPLLPLPGWADAQCRDLEGPQDQFDGLVRMPRPSVEVAFEQVGQRGGGEGDVGVDDRLGT